MGFKGGFYVGESGLLADREGEFVPGGWTCDGEGMRAECVEFGMWSPEKEGVKGRTEGARGCVDVWKVDQVDNFVTMKVIGSDLLIEHTTALQT